MWVLSLATLYGAIRMLWLYAHGTELAENGSLVTFNWPLPNRMARLGLLSLEVVAAIQLFRLRRSALPLSVAALAFRLALIIAGSASLRSYDLLGLSRTELYNLALAACITGYTAHLRWRGTLVAPANSRVQPT